MSIKDCKTVMKEYIYEIDGLNERIKDLEHAIKVKDRYIKKLEKKVEEQNEKLNQLYDYYG